MSNFDPKSFRNALGSFPTGVCVITTLYDKNKPFGMTVNSFASVSLDPALVLWSVQNDTECFHVFKNADAFCVNVLSSEQQELSSLYAKPGAHDLRDEHYHLGDSGMPVINGAVSTFECRLWGRYPGGDHEILVGETQFFKHDAHKQPLVFHAGKYAEVA